METIFGGIHVIWSRGSDTLNCIIWHLHYKEQRTKFTIAGENNDTLAFLDMFIKRLADKLITKVYRKDTITLLKIYIQRIYFAI